MTRRCRWLLGLGCWALSLLVAPDTWSSIGTETPSTAYASREASVPDVHVAETSDFEGPRGSVGTARGVRR